MRILALILSGLYSVAYFVCLADWMWQSALPATAHRIVFYAAMLIGAALAFWALQPKRRGRRDCWLALSCVYVLWWHDSVFVAHEAGEETVRTVLARFGVGGLFFIGLLWIVHGLERAAQHYRARRLEADATTRGSRDIWNPFDLEAWFYGLSPNRLRSFVRSPMDQQYWQRTRSRRLDQSVAGVIAYTFSFALIALVLSSLHGCEEVYEMPAGGGEQKQLAQVVRVQKIIRKRFVVNPFSAIIFQVPPIDEVRLNLKEITEHAYTVGYGEGKGAGFAGGTKLGKVRFIRLQYTGGDWDQDMGNGGDMNMLFEYGIRTKHTVGERTESRTISQLKNFPAGKSPPFVFLTGQKNISVSNSEVKTLRNYLNEKHGMIFADNGGSGHFHNQFLSLMNRLEPEIRPVPIPLDDVIHRIPFQIPFLPYVAPHGGKESLGWWKDGRWICYYHPGDIADAWSNGHAGVDRDVWEACYQLGTNVIFYAHSEYSKWLEAQKKEK